MSGSSYKAFGSLTSNSNIKPKASSKVDFSSKSNYNFVSQQQTASEGMADILNSAVGDFTERPLEIMIREIAKNFLIFTPIGWIILLYMLGRKYRGKLSNINGVFGDVINSLIGQKRTS